MLIAPEVTNLASQDSLSYAADVSAGCADFHFRWGPSGVHFKGNRPLDPLLDPRPPLDRPADCMPWRVARMAARPDHGHIVSVASHQNADAVVLPRGVDQHVGRQRDVDPLRPVAFFARAGVGRSESDEPVSPPSPATRPHARAGAPLLRARLRRRPAAPARPALNRAQNRAAGPQPHDPIP